MLRTRLFTISSVAVLLLASSAGLRSQIRARVDLVVVPVSVRDNNGLLVPNLDREDFKVYEDRKRQTITNFSVDAQPLSVAIVIDDGMSVRALKQTSALLHSLTDAFTPEDEMTAFRYDHSVWRLSEDFTSDHAQIEKSFFDLKRIAEARPEEPEQPELYSKIDKKTPGIVRAIAGIFSVGSSAAPNSAPTAPTPKPAPTTRVMHSAIYEAAAALQDRPQGHRRIILLVSDGQVSETQTSVIPGKTLRSFASNRDILLARNIEVYAVNTPDALLEKSSGILESYATATGGDVYGGKSESNMRTAFDQIVEQARTQYVLGYVSSNTAPALGVYRKIEVTSGDRDQQRKGDPADEPRALDFNLHARRFCNDVLHTKKEWGRAGSE